MNRILITLWVGWMAVVLGGCARPASNANGASKNGTSAAANTAASTNVRLADNRNNSAATGNAAPAPSPTNANSDPAKAGAIDASKLVGAYDLNQIQKGGVTTMMSDAKAQIIFTADGRYSRVIVTNGKMVNNESGQFSVAGDKLTFSVVLTGKTINKTPKLKDYTVALSPDGRELKLTSPTGETAIFNRAS
jgi:hypothetical protein